MSAAGPLRLGLVGCGNIAAAYARSIQAYPGLTLVAVTDLDPQRAGAIAGAAVADAAPAEAHRAEVMPDAASLLDRRDIDLVVNLTPPAVHYQVIRQALEAGKSVYTEKPMTLDLGRAVELTELAESRGLALYSAPMTFLGDAQRTALAVLREGGIGEARFACAELHNGPIETWHPQPEPFYAVGPVLDVGLYLLVLLIEAFGPVDSVSAIGRKVLPNRVTLGGKPFAIGAPDFVTAMLFFRGGRAARFSCSFVIKEPQSHRRGLEFYGDRGTLYLESAFLFDAKVEKAAVGGSFEPVPFPAVPFAGIDWARGLAAIARSRLQGSPNPFDMRRSLHALEALFAIHESAVESEASGRSISRECRLQPG